tara:strand:+ start:1895 stop:2611 length:717 start_codon:yes stop_codon:yes gene_type:complete
MRPSGRKLDEIRKISLSTNVNKHAEGSCLVKYGDTHVICTASVDERLPAWVKDLGHGWITAEYGMLPRSTGERSSREASRGKQGGRTMEIQRLIGRSLRAATNLSQIPEIQIRVDCDVVQADGGTRTASITGGFVALYQACGLLVSSGRIERLPFSNMVAAVSCGIYEDQVIVDLDYDEDSSAIVDSNFVMTEHGDIVEVQVTAEKEPFPQSQLDSMIRLAQKAIGQITEKQKEALGV